MKQFILTLLFFGLIAGVYAQEKAGPNNPQLTPQEKATKFSEKMEQELSLTAEQKEQVYAAKLEKIHKNNRLKQKFGDDKEAAKKEAVIVNEAFKKKIQETLDEEQFAKYTELKMKMKKECESEKKGAALKEKAVDTSPK